MAIPTPQELLDEAPCLSAMSTFQVISIEADLWCLIGQAVNSNIPGGLNAIYNSDIGAPLFNPDAPGIMVNPDI